MTSILIYAVSYLPDYLLAALILLTVWDIHSTSEVLKHGGYEENGILARVFAFAYGRWQHAGRFWTLVTLKGLFLGGTISAHVLYRSTLDWFITMAVIVAGYCWIAFNNWKSYRTL